MFTIDVFKKIKLGTWFKGSRSLNGYKNIFHHKLFSENLFNLSNVLQTLFYKNQLRFSQICWQKWILGFASNLYPWCVSLVQGETSFTTPNPPENEMAQASIGLKELAQTDHMIFTM